MQAVKEYGQSSEGRRFVPVKRVVGIKALVVAV
jgi:hypothetical protein